MTEDAHDERQRTQLTPEEEERLIVARKIAEAEAEAADEKVRVAVLTGAVFAIIGAIITLVAGLVAIFTDRELIGVIVAGATIGLVAGGVISAAQAGKLFGRGG